MARVFMGAHKMHPLKPKYLPLVYIEGSRLRLKVFVNVLSPGFATLSPVLKSLLRPEFWDLFCFALPVFFMTPRYKSYVII